MTTETKLPAETTTSPALFLVALAPGSYVSASGPLPTRTSVPRPTEQRSEARRFVLAAALPIAEMFASAHRQQSAPEQWLPVGAFLEVAPGE